MANEILKIQPTEKNPVVVDNYPYSFKRTQIRYWVESVKKKGDRFVSQTLNPKTNLWNKPKKSTYSAVIIVYKNKIGHTKGYYLSNSIDQEDYNKFIEFAGDLELNDLQKEQLKILRAYIKTYANVSFEIRKKQYRNKKTGEIVEQIPLMSINDFEEVSEEEQNQEQKETKLKINSLVAVNYHNDKGVL